MSRHIMSGILALALVTCLGTPAPAGPKDEIITIKFSRVAAPNTPKGKAAELFKTIAAGRTNGRVVVEVYPNSQLYKLVEEIKAVIR